MSTVEEIQNLIVRQERADTIWYRTILTLHGLTIGSFLTLSIQVFFKFHPSLWVFLVMAVSGTASMIAMQYDLKRMKDQASELTKLLYSNEDSSNT